MNSNVLNVGAMNGGTRISRSKVLEARLKQGPVVQRAALGDIRNKPSLLNVPVNKKGLSLIKKTSLVSSNYPLRSSTEDKENALPVQLPAKPKGFENIEKMEVEEEEIDVAELSLAFSSQMLNVEDIDASDFDNPQLVSVYVHDIYKYMWELEDQHKVVANYLDGQKITSRMRSILIDWLVQVHLRFTLLQETLYLTVAIIDRYLQTYRTITKDKLQLVGVTAMFIASKYEEMYIPEIGDFAYVTDGAFSKKDIRVMEVHMLNTLDFYISYPLPLHFLRRDSKAGRVDSNHHNMAKYLLELTLPEYTFSHYKPSLVAAGALYLSMKLLGERLYWDDTMTYYSNYPEQKILPVVYKLAALVIRSTTSKQQAIRNKYKSSKLMRISDRAELKTTSRLLRLYAEKSSSV